MTQVCRDLRLTVYVCVYVFMLIRVAKVVVSCSGVDKDFLSSIFGIFFYFKRYKTEDCGRQKISKQCIFVSGKLKTAVLVQKR